LEDRVSVDSSVFPSKCGSGMCRLLVCSCRSVSAGRSSR
jgi:hypothetical protein